MRVDVCRAKLVSFFVEFDTVQFVVLLRTACANQETMRMRKGVCRRRLSLRLLACSCTPHGGALLGKLETGAGLDNIDYVASSGLVARHAYTEAPPRVEYELTELGRTLIDPITMLAHWAEANGDAILDAHDRT